MVCQLLLRPGNMRLNRIERLFYEWAVVMQNDE